MDSIFINILISISWSINQTIINNKHSLFFILNYFLNDFSLNNWLFRNKFQNLLKLLLLKLKKLEQDSNNVKIQHDCWNLKLFLHLDLNTWISKLFIKIDLKNWNLNEVDSLSFHVINVAIYILNLCFWAKFLFF